MNKKVMAEGLTRIKNRGLTGNFLFYLKKLNVMYNDGYFHNVQPSSPPPDKPEGLLGNISYRLLWKEGNLYYVSAGSLQVIWDVVLILLMFGGILLWRDHSSKMFEICILGITLYLLLFEGRAKYLYMFLPIYTCMAGIVFDKIRKSSFLRELSRLKGGRVRA